jgi:heptosyltransferase III
MTKRKRILIVRPDRIGDVVLSTPLPREIKKQFPDSFVAVLVRKYTKDIYVNNPHVDKIITIDELDDGKLKTFWQKALEIRKQRFTHSLTLLPTEKFNYLLFFAGIKCRVGVGHKFYQFITFTKYVNRHKYIPLRHEADYCMDLARKIGVETNDLTTEIFLNRDERKKVELVKQELLQGKKYLVGIHTTSGNSAPNWKPDEYLRLVLKLNEHKDITVVITDNFIPQQLQNIDGVQYPNIEKSLRESLVNFSALDILISASTGPMHIAAALKVKTISMFCPMTACSPKLWGPLGNKNKIIMPLEKYCGSVCKGDPKKCDFSGNGGIDYNLVAESILELLR